MGPLTARHNAVFGRDDELVADVETLGALGNDSRYEALRLIAAADDELCVCKLEPGLGVSQGAVSQALSRLFTSGAEGRWRYYATTPGAYRLLHALGETRTTGSD
ncbi:ArsR family transcriptional regulator [Halomicrobium urmianum]|uniref:ArsR family transcriptional regulator n=1 Tax=Halomicrobium urmianum TaxID=1586233 RepID=UPI001CD9DDA9|nr:ArsR family transcriptional regulator [Halomicrobium urmianum]